MNKKNYDTTDHKIDKAIQAEVKAISRVYTRDKYGITRDQHGFIHEGVTPDVDLFVPPFYDTVGEGPDVITSYENTNDHFKAKAEKTWLEEAQKQNQKGKEMRRSNPRPVFDNDALQKRLKQLNKINSANINAHQIMFEGGERMQKVLREHPEDRNSLHEAWGFIREEMIELEAELMKKTPRYSQIKDEAYDVMITCARLIKFCNDRLPQEFLPDLKNQDGKYPGHEDHF